MGAQKTVDGRYLTYDALQPRHSQSYQQGFAHNLGTTLRMAGCTAGGRGPVGR